MMWKFDQFAQRKAVIDEHGLELTYSELQSAGITLCKTIGQRCLVFCICSNTVASLIGYTAFLNGRIVPVMLNAEIDPSLFEALYEKYRPAYLWAPQSMIVDSTEAVYQQYGYGISRCRPRDFTRRCQQH